MAFRVLLLYVFILMIYISSIKSSPLSDDFLIENDSSINLPNIPSVIIHPYNFISFICQQQEQYPSKIIRKLCLNNLQLDKIQEQQKQQRGKRVGWTISV
jgi:hypothetical protein